MKQKKALLLFTVLVAGGLSFCTSTKSGNTTKTETKSLTPNMPGEKELTAAKKRWPDVTLDELNKGQAIFYNPCTSCHQAYDIPGFSEKKWLHEIDDMSPKANLSAEQKAQLTKYILSFRDANTIAGK